MAYVRTASRRDFHSDLKMIPRTKSFISTLQILESRVDKIETPRTTTSPNVFKDSIKALKSYLEKIMGVKYNFTSTHWSYLKKNIVNTRGAAQKKEMIKNEIQHLKDYIKTKEGLSWDGNDHTDILYIYWHSKTELKIIKKVSSCLKFLDKEISRLENQNIKKRKIFSKSKQYCEVV